MEKLLANYKHLINEILPATYSQPVQLNHCFGRIVLDWLFQDCWYNHLNRKRPAYTQLSEGQLQQTVQRMQLWIQNQNILIADNEASLRYRKKIAPLHG